MIIAQVVASKAGAIHHKLHHPAHMMEKPLHMAYLAFVSWESHHIYGIVAFMLLISLAFAGGSSADA